MFTRVRPRLPPCSCAPARCFKPQLSGSPTAALEWLVTLPGPVRAVYEAEPTGLGWGVRRGLRAWRMMVCSPGAIPRQPRDRIKTVARGTR